MPSKTTPPAVLVERDPHWALKMQRLRERQLPERTVAFVLDEDAPSRVSSARMALAVAQATWAETHPDAPEDGSPEVTAAAQALADAEADLEEATVRMTFRGLPRPVFEELVTRHPPTDEESREGHTYNVETFAPELISACSVDGMTIEEADALLQEWNQAEAMALFQTALSVNLQARLSLVGG